MWWLDGHGQTPHPFVTRAVSLAAKRRGTVSVQACLALCRHNRYPPGQLCHSLVLACPLYWDVHSRQKEMSDPSFDTKLLSIRYGMLFWLFEPLSNNDLPSSFSVIHTSNSSKWTTPGGDLRCQPLIGYSEQGVLPIQLLIY